MLNNDYLEELYLYILVDKLDLDAILGRTWLVVGVSGFIKKYGIKW